MPKEHLWLRVDEWYRQYGDIVHLKVMGEHLIFLNTEQVAVELLEKRSKIYSDRAPFTVLNRLLDADYNLGFMPYGDRWRSTRRIFLEGFRKKVVANYEGTREKHTRLLLRRLDSTPEAFYDHLMHFASANILDTVYGIDPEELDQPLLQIAQRALDGMNEAGTTGVFSLLEQFPWLRYWPKFAPGGGFKKKLSAWKKDIQQMNDLPFATAVNYLRGGSASDHSLLARWLNTTVSGENHHRQDLKPEDLIKAAAGNAFVAGVETASPPLRYGPRLLKLADPPTDGIVTSIVFPGNDALSGSSSQGSRGTRPSSWPQPTPHAFRCGAAHLPQGHLQGVTPLASSSSTWYRSSSRG